VGLAGEELEGFGGLNGGGEINGGGEDAGCVAGFDRAGGGLGEDAGEAGGRSCVGRGKGRCRFLRQAQDRLFDFVLRAWLRMTDLFEPDREDVHRGGVGTDGGGVDPGFGLLDGVVVEKVAGLEVVGGVENEIGGGEELVDVGGDEVGDLWVDGNSGVKKGDLAVGGFGFGEGFAGIGLVEEDLALEVGGFDEVAVDEGECSDAGAGEQRGSGGSGGSDADDSDVRTGEELLAGGTDAGEENLAGVAVVSGDRLVGGGIFRGGGVDPGAGQWLFER